MMLPPDEDEAIAPRRRGRATSSATRSATTTCSASTAPAAPTCGRSTVERRAARASTRRPSPQALEEERLGRQGGGRRQHRSPRGDRHARSGPRVPAPLRGGRRRPGDLRDAGRAQPPRAHHGVDRAVRARGVARVHRPRRTRIGEAKPRTGRRSANRCSPSKSSSATSTATVPCPPPKWAAATGSPELQEWLERFRDDRAAGRSDTDIDTLGDLLSG